LYVKVHYLSVVCYNKIVVVVSIIVVLLMLLALLHAHHAIGMHHVMHQNLLKASVKSIGKSQLKRQIALTVGHVVHLNFHKAE